MAKKVKDVVDAVVGGSVGAVAGAVASVAHIVESAADTVAGKPDQHEMKPAVPGTAERLADLEIRFTVLCRMLGVTFKQDGDRYIAVK